MVKTKSKRLKLLIIHVVNVHTYISETLGAVYFVALYTVTEKETENGNEQEQHLS